MAVRSAPLRKSPLDNPSIREFLDGLAILIARRILAGTQGQPVEYATNVEMKEERER